MKTTTKEAHRSIFVDAFVLISLSRNRIFEHILGCDLEALVPISDILSLIERIGNTFPIVLCQSTVLHKLNCGFITEISRASLGAIIHDGYLDVASILISHSYG